MKLIELIDKAAEAKGSLGALAASMNKAQTRLSEWKKGERKPDAHEIAYLAECAGLPILETVADIESQLDERYATIWREALGKLRAAGVAATVTLGLGISLTMNPSNAEATPLTRGVDSGQLCILCQLAKKTTQSPKCHHNVDNTSKEFLIHERNPHDPHANPQAMDLLAGGQRDAAGPDEHRSLCLPRHGHGHGHGHGLGSCKRHGELRTDGRPHGWLKEPTVR